MIHISETKETDYSTRTKFNAENSTLTLYFCASEKETSGMSLTMDNSNQFYKVVIPGHNASIDIVTHALIGVDQPIINIAGNSIYRWSDYVSQNHVNAWVLNYIEKIALMIPNVMIRSGGQTGADWAGIVAAQKLGLECHALFPRGFRQRNRKRVDTFSTKENLIHQLNDDLIYLNRLF